MFFKYRHTNFAKSPLSFPKLNIISITNNSDPTRVVSYSLFHLSISATRTWPAESWEWIEISRFSGRPWSDLPLFFTIARSALGASPKLKKPEIWRSLFLYSWIPASTKLLHSLNSSVRSWAVTRRCSLRKRILSS
jgi:hypothetical protein